MTPVIAAKPPNTLPAIDVGYISPLIQKYLIKFKNN
jgi:hypothetical protein